jgi:hypothetical protein
VASQTWEQIWNAAMAVGPWRAASDAASVTQNVTATTLASRRNPAIHGKWLNSSIKQHLNLSIGANLISSMNPNSKCKHPPHPRKRRNLRHLRLGGTTSTFLTSLLSIISVIRYLRSVFPPCQSLPAGCDTTAHVGTPRIT